MTDQDTLWGPAPTLRSVPQHPAKFSASILSRLAQLLNAEPKPLLIIDPFAGVGGVHTLAGYGIETVGVEIEQEWAQCLDQVPVRGMRYGANSSVRVAFEVIIRARKDKQ